MATQYTFFPELLPTDDELIIRRTRACADDGFMRGFNVAAVEECVFERNWLSHKVNLFDMNSKYADVVFLDEALALLGF